MKDSLARLVPPSVSKQLLLEQTYEYSVLVPTDSFAKDGLGLGLDNRIGAAHVARPRKLVLARTNRQFVGATGRSIKPEPSIFALARTCIFHSQPDCVRERKERVSRPITAQESSGR